MTCKLSFYRNIFWLMYFEQLHFGFHLLNCNTNTWTCKRLIKPSGFYLSSKKPKFFLMFMSIEYEEMYFTWYLFVKMLSAALELYLTFEETSIWYVIFLMELFTLIAQLYIPFTFGFELFFFSEYTLYYTYMMYSTYF